MTKEDAIDNLLSAIEEIDARLREMSRISDHASLYTVRSMIKDELEDRGIEIPESMGR